MSPAHGHDVCQIGAYTANSADLPTHFQGFEARMLKLGGRPHWGKEFDADGATICSRYPGPTPGGRWSSSSTRTVASAAASGAGCAALRRRRRHAPRTHQSSGGVSERGRDPVANAPARTTTRAPTAVRGGGISPS